MKIKELIERLQKEDQEKSVFHYEIGGVFPIDTLVELPDGSIGLCQVETIEHGEEE